MSIRSQILDVNYMKFSLEKIKNDYTHAMEIQVKDHLRQMKDLVKEYEEKLNVDQAARA